jgi:hypothetical protein
LVNANFSQVTGGLGLSGAAFAQGNSPSNASGQGAGSSPSSANPGATAKDTKMKEGTGAINKGGAAMGTSSGAMAPKK